MPRQAQHPQLDLRQPAFGGAAEEEQARLGRGSQAHVPPANLSSGALAEQFNLHLHREDGRLSSAPGWLQKLLGPRRRSGGSSVASPSMLGLNMLKELNHLHIRRATHPKRFPSRRHLKEAAPHPLQTSSRAQRNRLMRWKTGNYTLVLQRRTRFKGHQKL